MESRMASREVVWYMAMAVVGMMVMMCGGVIEVKGNCPPPPATATGTAPGAGGSTTVSPPPPSTATSTTTRTCSVNLVELSVCSPLLGGGASSNCCALLGLLGLDLEVCLCLALDVNLLGLISVDVPKLDVVASILTSCGYTVPPNLTCP